MNPLGQSSAGYCPWYPSSYRSAPLHSFQTTPTLSAGTASAVKLPSAPPPPAAVVTPPPLQPIRHANRADSFAYFLVAIRRSDLNQRWGLKIATVDGYVEVSLSEEAPTSSCIQSCAWSTTTPRQPSWWWQYQRGFIESAVMLESFMKAYSWNVLTQEGSTAQLPLRDGDALIALNGQRIAGPCHDMSPVLDVFRKSLCIHMLLVRRQPLSHFLPRKEPPGAPSKVSRKLFAAESSKRPPSKLPRPKKNFVLFRNDYFRDPENPSSGVPFDDDLEYEFDEGRRANLFLPPIVDVPTWLSNRKRKWRESYKVHKVNELSIEEEDDSHETSEHVPKDFWTPQGFGSFSEWLQKRTMQWRQQYPWQRAKRQRIQRDVENPQEVSINQDFEAWLRVRKTQWRLARRQRQRAALATAASSKPAASSSDAESSCLPIASVDTDVLVMDSLLEEKEKEERMRQERPPLDISWLFNSDLGCPDDVVAHCMQFLPAEEHGKMLALNRSTRAKLAQRENVWRLLCPPSWTLPRRPRQPWHVLYWTKLKAEHLDARKRGDDILSRALNIMGKGDHLYSLERIVKKAEKDGKFDVDYSSGVVCERNSLLNLAVIHERHKIVRWLVEVKGANIETEDRGQFTPLLNAAWAGDKVMVRFFLSRGANRKHIGTSHYTRPLAPPDFEGKTADEWAAFRGHHEVAKLIQLGL